MKKKIAVFMFIICSLFVWNNPMKAAEHTCASGEASLTDVDENISCGHVDKLESWHVKLVKSVNSYPDLICPLCGEKTVSNDDYESYDSTLPGYTAEKLRYIPVGAPLYFVGENLEVDKTGEIFVSLMNKTDETQNAFFHGDIPKGTKYRLQEKVPFSQEDVGKLLAVYCYTKTDGSIDQSPVARIHFTVVDTPVKITENPEPFKVSKGNDAIFTCKATGTNLTYQWYYNDYDSTYDGEAIAGATKSTLTVKNVPSSYNNRYYYCKVSNYSSTTSYAKVTKTTETAKLTVTTPPTTKTPYKYTKKGTISSFKSTKKNQVTVKWKKVSGASGMQIQFAQNKSFSNTVVNYYKGSSTSVYKKATFNFRGFRSKKYGYCRVRPYVKKSGKTYKGKWSTVKKVKVK